MARGVTEGKRASSCSRITKKPRLKKALDKGDGGIGRPGHVVFAVLLILAAPPPPPSPPGGGAEVDAGQLVQRDPAVVPVPAVFQVPRQQGGARAHARGGHGARQVGRLRHLLRDDHHREGPPQEVPLAVSVKTRPGHIRLP
eukprot:3350565-Pyramimonas_sp.AAC.1